MPKKRRISVVLSDKAQSYFDQVSASLQSDFIDQDATDEEVVNYVFETLETLEQIVDDPATFIEGVVNGTIRIINIQPKQKSKNEPGSSQD